MKWQIFGDNTNPDEYNTAAFAPRQARAYCDGRAVFSAGGAIGDVPFAADTERENRLAWLAGYTSGVDGTTAAQTYCAV